MHFIFEVCFYIRVAGKLAAVREEEQNQQSQSFFRTHLITGQKMDCTTVPHCVATDDLPKKRYYSDVYGLIAEI